MMTPHVINQIACGSSFMLGKSVFDRRPHKKYI